MVRTPWVQTLTGKQVLREIIRIRHEIADLKEQVLDVTEKDLVARAATDEAAYRVLLNQPPLSARRRDAITKRRTN